MSLPTHLRYTAEHEWIEDRDGVVRIDVTPYAANALGDIVYVELPDVGDEIAAGQSCGELESTKSVSDLYAPVTGEVTAVNTAVADEPSLVNSDSFGAGWLLEVRAGEAGAVLTAAQYAELTGE